MTNSDDGSPAFGGFFARLACVGLDDAWRRGRVAVLIVGTAFAMTITHFVAQGIFEG